MVFSIFIVGNKNSVKHTVVDLKRLEVNARDGPSDPNALAMWRILNRLHDRNETMYYKVSSKLCPVVYLIQCPWLQINFLSP